MKAIRCKLYIFSNDTDARTASPNEAISNFEMKSINACHKYVKLNGIKKFSIFEIDSR